MNGGRTLREFCEESPTALNRRNEAASAFVEGRRSKGTADAARSTRCRSYPDTSSECLIPIM